MARLAAFIALPLAFALTALPALAGGPHGRRHGPPPIERILERHAERLGLDDTTRAEIRELAEAGQEAERPYRERKRALRRELRELLRADAPVESDVMAKAEEIGAVEIDLEKQRLRTMLAIRAVLTPVQRRELVEIHREWRERRREARGDDGPPGWRERDERE